MKLPILFLILPALALPAHAADAAAEEGIAAVTELGRLNGVALACGDKEAAARAKALMLRHAPRTTRYGEAFEQATQQGFLGQTKGQADCPAAQATSEKLEAVAKRIRSVLPEVEPK